MPSALPIRLHSIISTQMPILQQMGFLFIQSLAISLCQSDFSSSFAHFQIETIYVCLVAAIYGQGPIVKSWSNGKQWFLLNCQCFGLCKPIYGSMQITNEARQSFSFLTRLPQQLPHLMLRNVTAVHWIRLHIWLQCYEEMMQSKQTATERLSLLLYTMKMPIVMRWPYGLLSKWPYHLEWQSFQTITI